MRNWRLYLASVLCMGICPGYAQSPLPPGKPAGVRAAQTSVGSAIFVVSAAVIAVAGLAISNHPYTIPGQSSATSTHK